MFADGQFYQSASCQNHEIQQLSSILYTLGLFRFFADVKFTTLWISHVCPGCSHSFIHSFVYMYICTYMYVCMYEYLYIHVSYMYAYMFMYMYAYMCACICVSVCIPLDSGDMSKIFFR